MIDIGPNDPIPVERAAELFYPAGGVKAATLFQAIRADVLNLYQMDQPPTKPSLATIDSYQSVAKLWRVTLPLTAGQIGAGVAC